MRTGAQIVDGGMTPEFARVWVKGMKLSLQHPQGDTRTVCIVTIRRMLTGEGVRVSICDENETPFILDAGPVDPENLEFRGENGLHGQFVGGEGLQEFKQFLGALAQGNGCEMQIKFYSSSRGGRRKATVVVTEVNEAGTTRRDWFRVVVDIPEDRTEGRAGSIQPADMWFDLV